MIDAPASDAGPIVLPSPPPPARRGPLPLVASVVPVIAAVVMWLVTGSLLMLCFAALGPLMAVASLADGARGRRRERRAAERELAEACERAEAEVRRRHDEERTALERARPDIVRLAGERTPWTRGAGDIVVGRGAVPSAVRITGGEGEPAERLRERAARIEGAPVTVDARGGVCVEGDPARARAVARGLLLQLCLRSGPEELAVVGVPAGEEEAFAQLPHRRSRAALQAALVWDEAPQAADVVIAAVQSGRPSPPACTRVLRLATDGAMSAELLEDGADPVTVEVEGVSVVQAAALVAKAARRASGEAMPEPVWLSELPDPAAATGLAAVVGRTSRGPAVIDLVGDGPHAVVVGMTGSGKSELLCTWVASLARQHRPDEVLFLLADFKGGTAFEPLAGLPHVTGVVTDLDGAGARRAVESLRAELRRREAAIAAVGARDIADPRVSLPRLVVVVDEFAALLQDHADLHALFTDIAARGRALGMHLVLGTQRATGVLRDALLANCPLRIALRVADVVDSRAIIGTDAAAELPGDAASRGLALVRRAGDIAPELTRIARAAPGDARAVSSSMPAAAAPWLPPLPEVLPLERLRATSHADGTVLLGLADEPERQRQTTVRLAPGGVDRGLAVLGGAGSGKTAVARLVAAQAECLLVPADPEGAWDAVDTALNAPPPVVVIDDVDALVGRYPAEYAAELTARLETLVRDAGTLGTTVVCTAARSNGAVARVIDLLPRRAVLAMPTRAEHVAAGADAAGFDPRRRPGGALLDGCEIQFAWVDVQKAGGAPAAGASESEPWRPDAELTGLVVRAAASRAGTMAQAWGRAVRVVALDGLEPGAADLASLAAGARRLVIAGDGESWLRHAALLRQVRARGQLVIGAECASELRGIAGERELPPYARPRASRAWLVAPGAAPRRVVLP